MVILFIPCPLSILLCRLLTLLLHHLPLIYLSLSHSLLIPPFLQAIPLAYQIWPQTICLPVHPVPQHQPLSLSRPPGCFIHWFLRPMFLLVKTADNRSPWLVPGMSYICLCNNRLDLIKLGVSLSGPLSQADIMARIYSLACQYGSEQRVLHAMQSSESSQGNVGDMQVLFQELSIHLKDTFHLTKEQKVCLSTDCLLLLTCYALYQQISVWWLCQELIYKDSRTVFKSLHSDIEVCLPFFLGVHAEFLINYRGKCAQNLSWMEWRMFLASLLMRQNGHLKPSELPLMYEMHFIKRWDIFCDRFIIYTSH